MGHLIRGRDPDEQGTNDDAPDQPRDLFTWEIYRNARPELVPRGHFYFAFHSSVDGQERHIRFKAVKEPGYHPYSLQSITLPFNGRNYVENTWPVGGDGTIGWEMMPVYRGGFLIWTGMFDLPRRRNAGSGEVMMAFTPFEPGDALFMNWGPAVSWPPTLHG